MTKRRQAKPPWEDIVDFEQALKNVQHDLYGDWFRDPWGWPELKWSTTKRPQVILERIRESGVGGYAPIAVAKEGFGTRPALVMDPIDRLVYQALVDAMSSKLIGGLRPTAFGWRLPRIDYSRGKYSDNGSEHQMFRSYLRMYAVDSRMAALKTDIVSFFANVQLERLYERVSPSSGSAAATDRTFSMLQSWGAGPSRSGLPQRSHASAVLANAFLSPLDDALLNSPKPGIKRRARETGWSALQRMVSGSRSDAAARWMDDIWVFRRDTAKLRAIQKDIEALLRELGLDMNIAKTEVLEGAALWHEVAQVTHSAVEEALCNAPPEEGPLDELIDRLVESPEEQSATAFRFALRRMRDFGLYSRVHDLRKIAHRAPHAADSLARLFRASGEYRDMYGWFTTYWRSSWSTTDWAVAQFGTMFPTSRTRKRLADRYAKEVASPSGSLALVSLAAQRLAVKDPDYYRSALRAAIKDSSRPLERRALAMAALHCREERSFLRSALGELRENAATLAMLEERKFAPFKIVADYSGS